jgi:hypothetical protein
MAVFYTILLITLIFSGGALLSHLGAGSVPKALKPFANVWLKSGRSPKSFNVALWLLFALIAMAVLLLIGIPLYSVVNDMGRGFK